MLQKNKDKERNKKKRDFWSISPVTKIIHNKKKNRKEKHKERVYDKY